MCGIAGILTSSAWRDADGQALRAMQSALRHRGPDDEGLWTDPASGVGLAHTRLAILDLSPAGHQPMVSANGRYIITFNGEIYNFRELRTQLESEGHAFHTHSDTEVLLCLYATQGEAMLTELRGMFAFCIWDRQERQAFLARDPLGIKPLYYSTVGTSILFASEMRAIHRTRFVERRLNPDALVGYFLRGSVREPDTIAAGVACLPAGHWMRWRHGDVQITRFWHLEFPHSDPIPPADAIAATRTALLDSVESHFVSDVPVGLFLSSGIDSTAVLAMTRLLGKTGINTFTLGMDEPGLDEASPARRTAAHFEASHHEFRIGREVIASTFHDYLSSMDQPTFDGLNTFTVSRFAKQNGMKVVLSGLGGDELFGGYPSFQAVPRLLGGASHLKRVPGLSNAVGHLLERYASSSKFRRIGSFLREEPSVQRAFDCFRSLFSLRDAQFLASQYIEGDPAKRERTSEPGPTAVDVADAISESEMTIYMRNQLLKDSDVMSMAHGLELRTPLVDRTLIDEVTRLPAALRLQPNKNLLLQALPEIPSWVKDHPKRIFVFPFEKWLESSWSQAFAVSDARLPSGQHSWFQRWTVFTLDQWLKQG